MLLLLLLFFVIVQNYCYLFCCVHEFSFSTILVLDLSFGQSLLFFYFGVSFDHYIRSVICMFVCFVFCFHWFLAVSSVPLGINFFPI